jgi:uncharacterized protein YggE
MEPAQTAPQTSSNFTAHYVQESKFSWKIVLWIILGLILAAIFWQWITNPMVVTVTGTGTVTVPATSALVSFNVLTSDSTAQNAISDATSKAAAINKLLVGQGIPDTDIVQTQVTAGPDASDTGFQALIQMGVKTVHITDVPNLVASLYNSGATSVSQPVLSVDNQSAVQAQAFNAAMSDAAGQASKIASANWKFFRKIINVSGTSSGTTSTATSTADTVTQAENQQTAANGVFKIVQSVSVSYKMW